MNARGGDRIAGDVNRGAGEAHPDPDVLSATAELEFPYQHSTGPVIGRFLTALRDERRVYGIECRACRLVLVPPQDYCEVCGGPVADPISASNWREVGPEGTVTTFAVVRRSQAIHPVPAPFAYALIRLDGANTDLLHIVHAADYTSLPAGARVRPVWKDERNGSILDISHFELLPTEDPG